MSTDIQLLLIAEQLQAAQSNEEVEKIVSQTIAGIGEEEGADVAGAFLVRLQNWLENLSPLDWDSTQWSSLRYAFIYLREFQAAGPAILLL